MSKTFKSTHFLKPEISGNLLKSEDRPGKGLHFQTHTKFYIFSHLSHPDFELKIQKIVRKCVRNAPVKQGFYALWKPIKMKKYPENRTIPSVKQSYFRTQHIKMKFVGKFAGKPAGKLADLPRNLHILPK